jgi:CHASE2 domain-containing sensor protein
MTMIERRPFNSLGGANHGWLDAKHHFSFASYRDRARDQWGNLRVWNDVLCLCWLARAWAGQHGMWIRPRTPKRARWVAIGIAACIASLMLVSVAATRNGHADVALMLAPAGFVIALAGSRLWRYVHRREMTPVP